MDLQDNNKVIRSMALIFECPFIDLNDSTYQDKTLEMVSKINDAYLDTITVLYQTIILLDRGIKNPYLIYSMVSKVDINSTDPEILEKQWTEMRYSLANVIDDYLNTRNVEHKLVGESDDDYNARIEFAKSLKSE
jgi:hypothetical protein